MRHLRIAISALLAFAGALTMLCALAGVVSAQSAGPAIPAHAAVLTASPAIGSTIAQAPTQVIVYTAENINPDPTKSNLQVYGPGGAATAQRIFDRLSAFYPGPGLEKE